MVSSTMAFSQQAINKTEDDILLGNTWPADVALSYGSTYYWRVRAVNSHTSSAWSEVGVFSTEAAPGTVAGNEETQVPDDRTITKTVVTTIGVQAPSNTTEVTQVVTTTITVGPSPQGPPAEPGGVPHWLYYALACSGAIIAILLAVITLMTVRGNANRRL
jgi:hypothetical protein